VALWAAVVITVVSGYDLIRAARRAEEASSTNEMAR
jgi:hypothetical protein